MTGVEGLYAKLQLLSKNDPGKLLPMIGGILDLSIGVSAGAAPDKLVGLVGEILDRTAKATAMARANRSGNVLEFRRRSTDPPAWLPGDHGGAA